MAKPTEVLDPVEQHEREQSMPQAAPMNPIVPAGHSLPSADDAPTIEAVTARRVEVARDDALIFRRLSSYAAMAGDEVLTYRWPVKSRKTGKVEIVEGLTIKAAYLLERVYRNARVDVASIDRGGSWIFKATFVDWEDGIMTSRLFQQHKGVARLGGDDDARRLDMGFQIGQSKAIRNVIVNYLELPYGNFLLEEGKKNLVARVGKNLPAFRDRCRDRLAELGVDLKRVEAQIGRPIAEWLAPDVAGVIAQIKAVQDGMADPNDQWPPAEPRRADAPPAADAPQAVQENGTQPAPAASDQGENLNTPPARFVIDESVIGQTAILNLLHTMLGEAKTATDVDWIERANVDRIGKITGTKRYEWNDAVRVARARVGKPAP